MTHLLYLQGLIFAPQSTMSTSMFATSSPLLLRNRLSDTSLSHLMKIAIEGPNTLSDQDLDTIVDVWSTMKNRVLHV